MAHLTIVGAGIDGLRQLTDEARQAVADANIVFFSRFNADGSPTEIDNRAIWKDLDRGRYRMNDYRPDMYSAMAEEVVIAAITHQHALLLQPGSALILDAITRNCCKLARELDVPVKILPGVSSCETVLAELQADTEGGLQIVTAQTMLLRQTRLNREMTTVVLQPGYYDTLRWLGGHHPRQADFGPLARYLMRQLGAERDAWLVLSQSRAGPASIQHLKLAELCDVGPMMSPYHTLVVPGLDEGGRDAAFDRQIRAVRQ